MILQKPITTEKAIKMLEAENKILFEVDVRTSKQDIKKEFEEKFDAKIESINTQIRKNKKIAFIKLKKEYPAIDIATKLGFM